MVWCGVGHLSPLYWALFVPSWGGVFVPGGKAGRLGRGIGGGGGGLDGRWLVGGRGRGGRANQGMAGSGRRRQERRGKQLARVLDVCVLCVCFFFVLPLPNRRHVKTPCCCVVARRS